MKIGIIGAGFTGLAAAYYLSKQGHEVTIFEKDSKPGGLAVGYKEKSWDWTLEYHYHHWFTNDKSVLDLAKEINHKVFIIRPKTSSYVDGGIYQLDSPISLLKFPKISIPDRVRMGASLAFLRYNPVWKPFENYFAYPYLEKTMGKKGFSKLWEPLLKNKLGEYANQVSLAWFWARVYKRTPSLAYPEGGFLEFANHLEKTIKKNGGKFYYNTEIIELTGGGNPSITFADGGRKKTLSFDKIITTLPTFLFTKIAKDLPTSFTEKYKGLKGIGATNLIIRLKDKFLKDDTYWLSMCDIKSPILAVVEHTNFMNKKHYNNEHILYLGNYMEATDKRFSLNADEVLKLYDPWLKKINPHYKNNIIDYKLFKAPFAQPIVRPGYSKKIPPLVTPLNNVYLANIEQVYPWDRGTNYAVELGKKVTEIITKTNAWKE